MTNTTTPANDITLAVTVTGIMPRTGKIDFDEVISADIVAGESIRIYGSIYGEAFSLTFRVGDTAKYGGRNIDYLGKITAIGPKTVSFEGKRFDLYAFARLNWRFDEAKSIKRNGTWMD